MNKLKQNICVLLSLIFVAGMISGCRSKGTPVKLTDTINQIQGLDNYAPSGTLSKPFSDQVFYEVSDISWSGSSGTAEVNVITPDLEQIITNSIQSSIAECGTEDYKALLDKVRENVKSTLLSNDYPTSEHTVEMDAKQSNEGYLLSSNEEFEKIISGNVEEIFFNALTEELANESSNKS